MNDKYEKIGETVILINTIPATTIQDYAWVGDSYLFHLDKGQIADGYFILTISPEITCVIAIGLAIKIIQVSEPNGDTKIKDAYPKFKTLDAYKIEQSEKDNTEFAYELTVKSISNFNFLFEKHTSPFSLGREYKIPTYQEWLTLRPDGY